MIMIRATQSGEDAQSGAVQKQEIQGLLESIKSVEQPDGGTCLKLARAYETAADYSKACGWLCRIVDSTEAFVTWQSASMLLERILRNYRPTVRRTAKLAILGSYTTVQFASMLKLAALRESILLDVYEADFGQYQQEIIDANSG